MITIEEAKKAMDSFKAQGTSDEELLGALYLMFQDEKITLDELEALLDSLGYEFTDEEGNNTAQQYAVDYQQNLFYMERDYSFSIPEAYREDNQGFVNNPDKEVGLWFPNKYFN